jgi:putative FmdB family regulatory protein
MPIYEYRCVKCRAEFECLVRGDETPRCPTCQADQLERQLSVVAAPATSGTAAGLAIGPGDGGQCGRPQCGMYGCQGLN